MPKLKNMLEDNHDIYYFEKYCETNQNIFLIKLSMTLILRFLPPGFQQALISRKCK